MRGGFASWLNHQGRFVYSIFADAAALVSLIVLTPSYFAIINAIYAAVYAR